MSRWAALKAVIVWCRIIKSLHKRIQSVPVNEREPWIEQLRTFEGLLGNAVLHLIGVYRD